MVITIARQYGSGGRAIGKMLADSLNIKFYDKELINLAAKESGVSPEIFEQYDEKATNSLLYALSIGAASSTMLDYGISPQIPINDKLFLLQHDIIRKISAEPCVIVGRCADHVLSERKDCVKIFIYADMEKRMEYAVDVHNVEKEKAKKVIKNVDKSRKNYYEYYSDKKWGDPENYDLCINSGTVGVDKCAELIKHYLILRGMCKE